MPRHRIAVLPYGIQHFDSIGDVFLQWLIWPLGKPDFEQTSRVSDLGSDDHLIVYPGQWLFKRDVLRQRVNISVMVVEPSVNFSKDVYRLPRYSRRFFKVLAINREVLKRIKNGIFFIPADTWVSNWREVDCAKTEMLSHIASTLNKDEGHKLRHQMAWWLAENMPQADILGKAYQPFGPKHEGLAKYRYSLVIENSKEPHYFTEKLIDAFLCLTVPIYWGTDTVTEYFCKDSIIICNDFNDLISAVKNISIEDYNSRLDSLKRNQKTASELGDINYRAAKSIRDAIANQENNSSQ